MGRLLSRRSLPFFELGDKFTSLSQIKELLELREIVESATVEKAALHRTEEDLVELKQALVEMGQAVTDGTSGEKADLEFHLAIAKAAKNTLLVELLNNISELMRNSMEETRKIFIYSKQKTMNKLLEEHDVIYQAILHQNDVKAVDAMRAHLLEVKETILANFKA